MPSSAGYEPLPQHAEEDEETANGGDHAHTAKARKRPYKPGHIDLSKLDNAFKRCGGRLSAGTRPDCELGGQNPLRKR